MFFEGEVAEFTRYDILSLPNSRLKGRLKLEYSSSCPRCGGEDRFIFWDSDGGYWCRQCGLKGFVSDSEYKEVHRRVEVIKSSTPEYDRWKYYHASLMSNPHAQKYWQAALGPRWEEGIELFKLGFCHDYLGTGPTFTIPIGYGDKIYVIKHRILKPSKAKYLTEPRGSQAMLFNLDRVLHYRRVVLVEGEKKAIRLWLEGYPALSSTAGAEGFLKNWDVFFVGKQIVYLPDPDKPGLSAMRKIYNRLGGDWVELPMKPDDFINEQGKIADLIGEGWL